MSLPEIKYKQFVFVPKRPKMSPGKIASQVAHATFLALESQRANRKILGLDTRQRINNIFNEWEHNGMCVIVLEAKDTHHLNNIAKYLEQWSIQHHLYIDEGITEVDPMTPTALATGIITEDKFWMFERFELFGDKTDAQSFIDDNLNKMGEKHGKGKKFA